MPIPYLENLKWSNWSREERFYCAALYQHAQEDPHRFASWVNEQAELGLDLAGDWDVGYEVCFYRDFLWHHGHSIKKPEVGEPFPSKRTFDLCLFGERTLVIIEAKVAERFVISQNEDFKKDKVFIKKLDRMEGVDVRVVALASSLYHTKVRKNGRKIEGTEKPKALECFDGEMLTWANAYDRFKDPVLQQADALYGLKKGQLFERSRD